MFIIAAGPGGAQYKAGIVGSFPALNARPAELLDVWLTDRRPSWLHTRLNTRMPKWDRSRSTRSSTSRTTAAHDVAVCVKHIAYHHLQPARAPPEMMDAIMATAASCCMT